MVSRNPQAKITLGVDEKPLARGLQRATGHLNTFGSAAKTITGGISAGFLAIGAAIGGGILALRKLRDLTKQYVEAAKVQEAAETRLAEAMQARGIFTQEAFERQKQFASEIQNATTIGDEFTLAIQAQLVQLGVHESQLEDATKAALGFREMGGSLKTGIVGVARLLKGEAAPSLRRYGVDTDNATRALQDMQAALGQAEAKARTFEGRSTQLDNTIGDLGETLGFAATRSGAAISGLESLNLATADLINFFGAKEGREIVNSFFGGIMMLSADTIDAFLGMRLAFKELEKDIQTSPLGQRFLDGFVAEPLDSAGRTPLETLQTLSDNLRAGAARGVVGAPGSVVPPRGRRLRGAGGGPGGTRPSGRRGRQGQGGSLFNAFDPLGSGIDVQNFRERFSADMEILSQRAEAEKKLSDRIEIESLRRQSLMATEANASVSAWRQIGNAAAQGTQQIVASGITQTIGGLFSDIGGGFESVLASFRKTIGGIIQNIGVMLIQMGTGGVLAGALGTVIPAFAGLTGGPLGVGGGLAAIAGGSVLVAAGAALGGNERKPAAGAAAAARQGGSTGSSAARSGAISDAQRLLPRDLRQDTQGAQARTITIHYNGFIDRARNIRDVVDALRAEGWRVERAN